MATEREKMGRLVLKASTGVHGEIAKKLALELSAALAAPPVGQQAAPVAWTPGPNVFKDWCNQWFGPDADDDYLAKAVFALPPVAQRFSEPAQPAPQAGAAHSVVSIMRAMGKNYSGRHVWDKLDAAACCLAADEIERLRATEQPSQDAERYRKLRRWMSSNVAEGWTQVEQLAAIACYVSWDAFDESLDALPECNFGLAARAAQAQGGAA